MFLHDTEAHIAFTWGGRRLSATTVSLLHPWEGSAGAALQTKDPEGADPTLPGLMGTLMQVWFKGCLSAFPVREVDRTTFIKSDYEPKYSNV